MVWPTPPPPHYNRGTGENLKILKIILFYPPPFRVFYSSFLWSKICYSWTHEHNYYNHGVDLSSTICIQTESSQLRTPHRDSWRWCWSSWTARPMPNQQHESHTIHRTKQWTCSELTKKNIYVRVPVLLLIGTMEDGLVWSIWGTLTFEVVRFHTTPTELS